MEDQEFIGKCLGGTRSRAFMEHGGMTFRRAPWMLVAVLSVVLSGGCLFGPREPDGPPEDNPVDWQTPINTSIVLQNLKASFEGKSISNYRNCFADTYRFHVDPADSLDAGEEGYDRYANWTREDEEHAAQGIFGDAAGITVSFTNVEEPQEDLDITYRRDDYELTVEWESGEHVNEEITYKGRATLWMRRDNTGRWAIFRWVDRRSGEEGVESWGKLRGDYRL